MTELLYASVFPVAGGGYVVVPTGAPHAVVELYSPMIGGSADTECERLVRLERKLAEATFAVVQEQKAREQRRKAAREKVEDVFLVEVTEGFWECQGCIEVGAVASSGRIPGVPRNRIEHVPACALSLLDEDRRPGS